MDASALHLLPLGGTGEIGMNLNLYHHQGRWLMVDCGVMFGREGPHVHYALHPDASFIAARREQLDGLVLTHAHQDHLGAVRDLWPSLRCPVYLTAFAAHMLRGALIEAGIHEQVPLRVIGQSERFSVGPFDLQRIPLTHSTPESGALVVRTKAATVLHTGDFKLDPDPRVGRRTDEAALRALRHETITACVSDSTNAHVEGWTPSEGALVEGLTQVIRAARGRVAVGLFASNVARIRTLAEIAEATGRHVVALGRSLDRTIRAARLAGYLEALPAFIEPREFGFLPPEKVLLLCTGSQGEPRAALSKLAEQRRRDVYLEPGDTVIFSARRIPGNELFRDRLEALLAALGVRTIGPEQAFVHVSGHPCREELRTVYRWVRPQTVIPVHGTPSHLRAHAELAEELGCRALQIRNGHLVRLGPGPTGVVGSVPTGRIRRVEEVRRRPGSRARR
ncbi:MAG: ribonuclease J [Deltaproteobacteria bacterium]|nr:MAG: ribonuclease J [Deltaproteobacteria bacterium]